MAPRTARSKDEGTGTGARYAVIKPEKIPQYTGDLAQLEKDHGDLKTDAGHIRDTGADVHSQFQGLSAYYKAPEAEQLFASTKPVKDRADDFADDLEKVSSALSDYATEIRPLVTKLARAEDRGDDVRQRQQGRRRLGVRRGQGRGAQPAPRRHHRDGRGVLGRRTDLPQQDHRPLRRHADGRGRRVRAQGPVRVRRRRPEERETPLGRPGRGEAPLAGRSATGSSRSSGTA